MGKKAGCFTLLIILILSLAGCGTSKKEISNTNQNSVEQEETIQNASESSTAEKENEAMNTLEYDFTQFPNVEITGIDIDELADKELSVLYQAAIYCQAMTDADIDTMREIVSEDMIFTHMSGKQQTREEYFADIERGRLRYYTIGMENPEIDINGDTAVVTYTSVLNANAYGARGTYRMSGSHYFENIDGTWYAVNRP